MALWQEAMSTPGWNVDPVGQGLWGRRAVAEGPVPGFSSVQQQVCYCNPGLSLLVFLLRRTLYFLLRTIIPSVDFNHQQAHFSGCLIL